MFKRIIARLDIKNNTLVKGISLEGIRVLGKPRDFILKYYKDGIDEIYFQDVVASLYNRNSLEKIIKETVQNIFVSISVGGGIRSVADIKKILELGADKVSINSAAVKNPELIKQAAETFGSSTVSINVETAKINSKNMVFIESGREKTKYELFEWVEQIQHLGAGEVVVTSISHEGRKQGLNIDLYSKLKKKLKIPLLAHGGAGNIDHLVNLFNSVDLEGVIISSLLHYSSIENFFLDNAGNTTFQKNFSKKNFLKITVNEIKKKLLENNIKVRL